VVPHLRTRSAAAWAFFAAPLKRQHIIHRANVEDRRALIERSNFVSDGGGGARGIHASANHKRHARPARVLREWHIHLVAWFVVERSFSFVDNTDYLARKFFVGPDCDVLSDGTFAGPQLARRRFVDDHDLGHIL